MSRVDLIGPGEFRLNIQCCAGVWSHDLATRPARFQKESNSSDLNREENDLRPCRVDFHSENELKAVGPGSRHMSWPIQGLKVTAFNNGLHTVASKIAVTATISLNFFQTVSGSAATSGLWWLSIILTNAALFQHSSSGKNCKAEKRVLANWWRLSKMNRCRCLLEYHRKLRWK